jgi:nitroimidazol reductase NimA-like FMN-containing flavoprotein (pyridoxamine 5'-phosphate oxidase superfamily)
MLNDCILNQEGESIMFREIARKKQALSKERITEILLAEKRGVLSVIGENGYPYGLPINYWYNEENGCIYFHSGKKGHKVEALENDNRVSFCVYDQGYQKDGEWALNISSVIVFGRIYPVEDHEKAMAICKSLSLKYTQDLSYIESEIRKFGSATLCYELRPAHITGKIVNES